MYDVEEQGNETHSPTCWVFLFHVLLKLYQRLLNLAQKNFRSLKVIFCSRKVFPVCPSVAVEASPDSFKILIITWKSNEFNSAMLSILYYAHNLAFIYTHCQSCLVCCVTLLRSVTIRESSWGSIYYWVYVIH